MLFQLISHLSTFEAAQSEMTFQILNTSSYMSETNSKKKRIEQNKTILGSDPFGLKAKDCLCCCKKPAPIVTQDKLPIKRSKKVCREEGRVNGSSDFENTYSFIQQKATKPSSSSSRNNLDDKQIRQGNSEEDHLMKEW